ncbi:hypothetical protein DEU56DRAFT_758361 [Suillus clintonianus]|uniref:uncharacterized protein n=1 Tax=Suillus clintonianus TaxID=1904413 RepID=UPI001B875F08|nr:uncharacterized protein DEU56DRAFT_760319 [Suillus clintonianus]XP_041205708.1 uncharacterized protein DEU56DRAFT_758361 [Suillus clintonianus]KAG2122601.1 hypothetical protein DEU56DRAFT_760319 [Suillus clintonianus]KAG2128740.1 hypothetical protein DEU56DRAFT_758361 [Suillus clintonianus]
MAGLRWIKAADAPTMSCDHSAAPCYLDVVVMSPSAQYTVFEDQAVSDRAAFGPKLVAEARSSDIRLSLIELPLVQAREATTTSCHPPAGRRGSFIRYKSSKTRLSLIELPLVQAREAMTTSCHPPAGRRGSVITFHLSWLFSMVPAYAGFS